MAIKTDKKQSFVLSSDSIFFIYILRVKTYFFFFFLNKTLVNFSFCRIGSLSFYFNKNELTKKCQENHQVKGMRPNICFFVFPHTPKFWDAYVITYGSFMAIVEPCTGKSGALIRVFEQTVYRRNGQAKLCSYYRHLNENVSIFVNADQSFQCLYL